jgi:AcrR family transcriptional regulator
MRIPGCVAYSTLWGILLKKSDPRVIRTRQLLRDALLDLMADKGFESISVQDITEKARLNRATFYLHYADKHDLLAQMTQDVLDELRVLPVPVMPDAPEQIELERLQMMFELVFTHVARQQRFYALMLSEGSPPQTAARIHHFVYEIGLRWLARAGRRDWQIPPEMMMHAIAGAYLGIVRWWIMNGMRPTSREMAQQFMQFILFGIISADATGKPTEPD